MSSLDLLFLNHTTISRNNLYNHYKISDSKLAAAFCGRKYSHYCIAETFGAVTSISSLIITALLVVPMGFVGSHMHTPFLILGSLAATSAAPILPGWIVMAISREKRLNIMKEELNRQQADEIIDSTEEGTPLHQIEH